MGLLIVSIFPERLNTNGDAENARVLAQRARWAGVLGVELRAVNAADEAPAHPDLVVVGSPSDAQRESAHAELCTVADALRDWHDQSVPLIAIGAGWELLSEKVRLADGTDLDGIGIFPAEAIPRPARVSDDLVVDSPFGRLIGYENHSLDYRPSANAEVLGRVVYGSGNGAGTAAEGAVCGSAVGTHLHGPVLAKNPVLADHLLRVALERRGAGYQAHSEATRAADEIAWAVRNEIAARLGLTPEHPVTVGE